MGKGCEVEYQQSADVINDCVCIFDMNTCYKWGKERGVVVYACVC